MTHYARSRRNRPPTLDLLRVSSLLVFAALGCDASGSNDAAPSDATDTSGTSAPTTGAPTTPSTSTPAQIPPASPPPASNPSATVTPPSPTPSATAPGASGATEDTASTSALETTDEPLESSGPVGSSSDDTTTGAPPSSDRATQVCARWNDDRADMREGTWSGNVDNCEAGDISPPGRENALKLVNLYRFLAGMPAVEMDPERNARAQECALLQSANGLSHDPPMSWKCYTEVGAKASGVSSLSGGRGVMSIDLYMTDGAINADTMGHRRWIFANSLGPVGFGSATSSCFYQADGTSNAGMRFVAWPPPGPVPLQAILATEVDEAGWTIQSDSINLSDATVAVEEAGQPLAVSQFTLPGGYGSRYALRVVPTNWKLQAGHGYRVTASGTDIDYTIDVVDCEK